MARSPLAERATVAQHGAARSCLPNIFFPSRKSSVRVSLLYTYACLRARLRCRDTSRKLRTGYTTLFLMHASHEDLAGDEDSRACWRAPRMLARRASLDFGPHRASCIVLQMPRGARAFAALRARREDIAAGRRGPFDNLWEL